MGCFGSNCSFHISSLRCSSASIGIDCFCRNSSRSATETSLACRSTANRASISATASRAICGAVFSASTNFLLACATAVQGEVEYVVGVRFIAHIHPHACRLRLARAQHRQDGVVGGHHMRLPDPLGHPLVQRLDHIRYISAPHRLCGPRNLKALPLENIFQPVEWQVIGELAGYDES